VEAREKAGLTQEEVAVALGKRQSFVSKYESGERKLEVLEFIEVCKALGASAKTIMAKVEEKL
jgi:transcriptional regulator with XRE-family HTH domain